MRCAALHQGKFNHDYPRYEKILFQVPNPQNNVFHNNILGDALNLNIERFVADLIKGYEEWKKNTEGNDVVKRNWENSVKYHPNGLSPYMVGVALLA